MALDRRSFKVGVIAGVFLIVGTVIGVLLTAGYGLSPIAHGKDAAPTPTVPVASAGGVVLPSMAPVAKATSAVVVNISTTRVIKSQGGGQDAQPFMDDPFFRQFFGEEFQRRFQVPKERRENSLGSGVIVSADGYIVTNNHVIAKADEIKVLLSDKREFKGKLVGADPKSDVAVIKIEASDLPTIPWGDSDKLEAGEFVLAVGNPFGLNQTVTFGIVSAVGRSNVGIADYEDFIQTDVAINPGNSGGALVNVRGELIGINTAIFSRSGGNMGIGFAVPAGMVKTVMGSLIKSGKVTRGWLGVSIQPVTPELAKQFGQKETRGALVNDVIAGTPAANAGIQSGDIITAFDGKPVSDPTVLRNIVAGTPIGKTVKVDVLREKKPMSFEIKISEQPKEGPGGATDEEKVGAEEGKHTALAGLEVQNLTPEISRQLGLKNGTAGVVVTSVDESSDASQAGLEEGDVIVELNRTPVRNLNEYRKLTAKLGKKDTVLLLVLRRGGRMFLSIPPSS